MDDSATNEKQPSSDRSPRIVGLIHPVLFALFLIQLALVCARLWIRDSLFGEPQWPEAILLVLTVASILASLARQLPTQNVLLAASVIVLIAGSVQVIGAMTAIPFGPFEYTERLAGGSFHFLPWPVPLVWVAAILTSRGVARLIMRPWRRSRTYGFWVIGITAILVVVLDAGLEPFATRVMHYWFWNRTRVPFDWYGAPCVNFLAWGLTALLIMTFITPSLINKRAMKQPPDYHPLIVWLLLNVLFAAGALAHKLWPAALAELGCCAIAVGLAVRGAVW